MNVRTATLLSIAGVLVAGTAAVAVNTQVLSGTDAPAEMPTALTLPVSTQVYTLPSGSVATSATGSPGTFGTFETDLAPTGDAAVRVTPLAESSTTLMSFRIGDAAVATIDTANGVLVIKNVAPSPGWTVAKADGSGTVRLDFVLTSATSTVDFGAFLSGGEVITSVSSEALAPPTSGDDGANDRGDDDGDHGDDDDHDDEVDGHDDESDDHDDEGEDHEDHDRGDDDD